MSNNITAELIREAREASGAPILRSKQVLEEMGGDKEKTIAILREEGFAKLEKRADRATSAGLIASYQHHTGTVVGLCELLCETDFVAKNKLFVKAANEIAMQIASMNPKDREELLDQDFIKDPSKKISDIVKEVNAKTGENVQLGRIFRMEVGN